MVHKKIIFDEEENTWLEFWEYKDCDSFFTEILRKFWFNHKIIDENFDFIYHTFCEYSKR